MKKYYYLWMAALLGASIMLFSCAKDAKEDIPEGEEINTPSGELVSSGEQVADLMLSKGNIPSYLKTALIQRFASQTAEIDKARVAIFSSETFEAEASQKLLETYNRGTVLVIVNPDMVRVERVCHDLDIPFGGAITNQNNLALFAFNSGGDSYSMDDPFDSDATARDDFNQYLNPFTSWLNQVLDKKKVTSTPNGTPEPADVQKTFDYQTISHTYSVHLKKELGTVLWSTPDTVEASGQVTLSMSIYPLYAFEDQQNPGDYYIINTTLTAHNETLYLGEFENRHGGVHVHMCAYILRHMEMTCSVDPKSGYPVNFPLNGTPTPLTTQVNQTFTNGMSWSLGGSLTGGLEATGPSVAATINAGVTFENSTSVQVPDLIIANNWSGGTVKSKFSVDLNATGEIQGYGMHEPTSFLCKSNMEVYPAWIWHVGGTKDVDTTSFTGQCKVVVTYKTMRYYSSVLDGAINNFDDGIPADNQIFHFRLHAPNRVATGSLLLKNTDHRGNYITHIKLWKEGSDYQAAPLYAYNESIANGNEMTKSIATGKYMIQIEVGQNASSLKTYHTSNAVEITRGEISTINSGFDFTEGAL